MIKKKTNELRTLNVQRPTSNIEFCQFKKNTEQQAAQTIGV
jgi:hypothetical protein